MWDKYKIIYKIYVLLKYEKNNKTVDIHVSATI